MKTNGRECCFAPLERRLLLHAGSIDLAFNNGALVSTTFGGASSMASDVKVLGDGGILAVGLARAIDANGSDTGASEVAIVKYRFDGSLDPAFATNGELLGTPRSMIAATQVELAPDGGFIVLGNLASGEALLKFTSTGAVDSSFGKNGVIKIDDNVVDFAVDSSGRIFVATTTHNFHAVLQAYSSNGRPDVSFNNGGAFIVNPTGGPSSDTRTFEFSAVSIDPQDRILLTATQTAYGNASVDSQSVLYRLKPNGQIDRSFGGNGHPATQEIAVGVQAIGNGDIMVLGQENVFRLHDDGTVDQTYGTQGKAFFAKGSSLGNITSDFAVDADGAIVRTFTTGSGSGAGFGFSVIRLNSSGVRDTDFGSLVLSTQTDSFGNGVALAPDGTVVVAGQIGHITGQNTNDTRHIAVARVITQAGPAVQIVPRTLRTPTRYLNFDVLIRTDNGVNLSTLANNDLKLFDADGQTRKIRFLSSQDVNGDGKYIRATYRIIGPNSSPWSSSANGTYEVRVQRKQITDKDGTSAIAQVLGTVRVKIA